MQCMLSGSLPMTVSWIKDDRELTEDEHIKMSYESQAAVLNLRNTQISHGGKYICQAQNEAGSQKCLAVLTVKGWSDICVLFHLTAVFHLYLFSMMLSVPVSQTVNYSLFSS